MKIIFFIIIVLTSVSAFSQSLGFRVERHDLDHSEVSASVIDLQSQIRKVSEEVLSYTVTVNTTTQDSQSFSSRLAPEMEGNGSGVIIARNNGTVFVLTNRHVILGARSIDILLNDGRKFKATNSIFHGTLDIGIVEFETEEKLPIAKVGNSDQIRVGDFVIAAGAPLGFSSTITFGIVSAIRDDVRGFSFIQTDASINPGNSGGPLVDINGYLIGINTWIASQTGGSIGLGFSIPINDILETFDQ